MLVPVILAAASVAVATPLSSNAVAVSEKVPADAGPPVLQPFVGFSIEFAFFPDFAGNKSQPNIFSKNLLDNIGNIQGAQPIIRVGGNTQDYALYDPSLKSATYGTIVPSKSTDYPTILSIGPSYFESYATWPGTKFSHGFNLGKNGSEGTDTLLATVPLACKALQGGKLAYWELGNEPDLYKTSAQGPVRPSNWTEKDYVDEWLTKTRLIKSALEKSCPDMVNDSKYQYIAPSFAGVSNSLNPVTTWREGLNTDHDIALNSEHNYIGGATQPGVTLQHTLMNHTSTANSVAQHVNVSRILSSENLTPGIPYILGETNSLYNEGAPGLSNAFGAALWGVDFNLYCASQGIRRTHMHQGLDYRYNAWQPIQTNKTTIGTKAPYYGNVFVAEMVRGGDDVQIVNLPLQKETEAAYAAYVDDRLERIAVVNLVEYNYTDANPTAERPSAKYTFQIPSANGTLTVQRLSANGSNAVTGITWDGWSYNYELDEGKPVRLHNVTVGETVPVQKGGIVEIEVPYSSAVILNL
ncbi:CAZyme family GH79 [Paecilomyces variotii]|nr:CAZyme family GH79 [Paecilomyces variotii]